MVMLLQPQLYRRVDMGDWKSKVYIGVAFVGVLAGGLYIKNVIFQGQMKELGKDQIIHILKKVRKEKYIVLKQVAAFATNIRQQMRNNVNTSMVEQFIKGPESPVNLDQENERILREVCESNETTVEEFNLALEKLEKDEDIGFIIQQASADYKKSLAGGPPQFYATVPASLTKQKFLELQNAITKKAYVQQVEVFRKLSKYSEEDLQENPSLLKGMGNPEKEQQEILEEEELDTEYVPALAIFEKAVQQFRNDQMFMGKIARIEKAYQQVLMKYVPKMQSKTITDRELNEMEDEFIYLDPLV